MHARDRSIADGVDTMCMTMGGSGIACLPFRKGDHVPDFLMLGYITARYITATWWGWERLVALLVP